MTAPLDPAPGPAPSYPFRRLFEASPIAMVMVREGRLVDANDAFAHLAGLASREEALGRPELDFIPPGLRGAMQDRTVRRDRGEPVETEYETEVLCRDGTVRPVRVSVARLDLSEGTTWAAFLVDLSESRAAQEDLREREAFLEAIVENIPDMIFVKDAEELRFVRFNRAGEDLLGFRRQDLYGRNDYDFFPKSEADFFVGRDRDVLASGAVQDIPEEPIHTANGLRFLHTKKIPVRDADGKPQYLLGISEDITVRKKAEEGRARMAAILESTSDMVGTSTVDGKGVYLNRAGRHLLGISEDEDAEGIGPMDLVPPENLERLAAAMERVQRLGTLNVDTTLLARDGRRIPVSVVLVSHPARAGEPALVSVIARDMTEKRQFEEDLARSNRELELFAYVASHDLQEPLRMVGSFVQLLERKLRGHLDEDCQAYIGFAVDGARRAQQLINDLLAFSRVGTRGREPVPVDAGVPLKEALANLDLAIREAGAAVETGPMPTVLGDATQLVQLFQNLVGNALKFRGDDPPRVQVSARRVGAEWEFEVRDNGIGIDPQYHERIFVIFQRLHTRAEYPGTGLGLALVKKIVERHSGRIWVESEEGKGATFHFTLRDAS